MNQRGVIGPILLFLAILALVGLYNLFIQDQLNFLVENSSVYGPNSNLYGIFIGGGLIISLVSLYALKVEAG